MNIYQTTKASKSSLLPASFSIAVVALFMGLLISVFPSHRQYFPIGISTPNDGDIGDAKGMEQFFFNARRDIKTNKINYASMLAADIADRAMNKLHRSHGVTTVPAYNWISMGPTNIGGRTRAILVDNNDPSHQTIFAGGITGGIWKSTNGGGSWGNASAAISYSLNDTLSNMNICCLAQDKNGAIYAGTGEGFTAYGFNSEFSSGELGGGIFKSTDDGITWRRLASTKPTNLNDWNVAWSYVNRIAISSDSFQLIYAATNEGLMVSHDSGATWNTAVKSGTSTKLNNNSLDVKISTDGSVVVACIGGFGYYCYPKSGNSNGFTVIKSAGIGRLFGNASRIEFAISPTDANRIYASVIQGNGIFGTGGTNSGIFMTMNAETAGGYWHDIGPGGSTAFDPYTEPGGSTYDQATYDNTLGVFAANEAQVLAGGTTLWEWSGANTSDTVGEWQQISPYGVAIHPDLHAIVFDLNNPTTVYIGCDGGMYKCSNMSIDPSYPTGSIASLVIQSINRNYNVTQYYTICYSPSVNYVAVDNDNTTMQEGLGLGGGTQDNGSPYVNGISVARYPNDATDVSGGDGAGSAVSQLNPNIGYFCSDYGTLLREGNLGALSSPTIAYTKNTGDCRGGDIDSMWNVAQGKSAVCFVFPVALYENPYDMLNHDSLKFINTSDSDYLVGNIIWPISSNGNITYPYVLPVALGKGDTLTVPDRVVSRLAVGFSGSTGGIWINGQGASDNTVVWMPIGGTLSKPTPFSDGSAVHALAWSCDGNTLFAGCEDGGVYRFTNINSVIANNYCSGALWYNEGSIHPTGNTNIPCIQLSTGLSSISGRDILSIATDAKDTNNVLITAGNYNQTDYVYYSNNAMSANPTFTIVQGNLPAMPVYGSILDILDSNGNSIPNSAMIATEHGIYTTTNITAGAGTKWVKNNKGMANVMTLAIKQQIQPSWLCNNSGDIYAGTHGRGLWAIRSSTTTAVPAISAPAAALNNLLIYPNPMSSQGNIEFNIASADNITINIYDMQGNIVKTITMGNQSQGNHIVSFTSQGLRSGTYFASLTGNNFRKVSKFVVVN